MAAKLEYRNRAATGRTPLSNALHSAVEGDDGAYNPKSQNKLETPVGESSEGKAEQGLNTEGSEGHSVTPESGELQKLLGVNRDSLITLQEGNLTIKDLRLKTEEGVSRQNVAF